MAAPITYERGHFQVLLAGVLVGTPVGSFYSWSVLNDPIYAARPNWGDNAAAHALSALLAAFGLSCSISGKIAGVKISNKVLSLIGSLIAGGAAVLCGYSIVLDLVVLFYIGAVFVGFGFGMGYVAFIRDIMNWWKLWPGFASGMCMMLSSAGSFIFVWILFGLLNLFEDSDDLTIAPSKCLIWYGLFTGSSQAIGSLLMGPQSNIVPSSSASITSVPLAAPLSTLRILTSVQFWMLFWMFFANLTPMLGILSIFANFLPDKFPSFSSATAANYLAALNIVGTIMRLFVGLAQSTFGTRPLFAFAAFLQCVIYAILPSILATGNVTFFIALLFPAKIAYGASFPLINIFAGETFGTENRAQVYGLLIFGLVAAALVGPTIISIDDSTTLFNTFCCISAILTGLGFLCVLSVRPMMLLSRTEPLLSAVAGQSTE